MFSFFDFDGDGQLGIFEKSCRDAFIFSTLFDNDDDDDDTDQWRDDDDGWED